MAWRIQNARNNGSMGRLKSFTILIISSISLSACLVFGIRGGVAEVPFTVLDRIGAIEIRAYNSRVIVEVADASDTSEAFFLLYDYITGANEKSESIAMTAPVEVGRQGEKIPMTAPVEVAGGAGGKISMRFFLPKDVTLSSAPVPRNPRVRLAELHPEVFAAIQYSGVSTRGKEQEMTDQIKTGLEQGRWVIAGEPKYFGFDPPYTIPFLRRNEVMIRVEERKN